MFSEGEGYYVYHWQKVAVGDAVLFSVQQNRVDTGIVWRDRAEFARRGKLTVSEDRNENEKKEIRDEKKYTCRIDLFIRRLWGAGGGL